VQVDNRRRHSVVPHKNTVIGPLLGAGRNIVYCGARGPVTIRDGRAEMLMYLVEADGLDFRLIKTI
jgi:hypothetical protein